MGKFFTVEVLGDIVNGDVSNVQNANKGHLDISAGDVLFDWTPVDVPKGTNMLRSIIMTVNGEDASSHGTGLSGYQLLFAKSNNGNAPDSLGAVNSAYGNEDTPDLRSLAVGTVVIDPTAHSVPRYANGHMYNLNMDHSLRGDDDLEQNGGGLPIVMTLEPDSGTNVGFDKLYVACILDENARGFHTGVVVNGAITSDTEDVITVDGVDANRIFSVGDTVYLHDVDTALGTVKSINDAGTRITLNAAIAGGTDLADDDELINANPIRITLGFER